MTKLNDKECKEYDELQARDAWISQQEETDPTDEEDYKAEISRCSENRV